MAPEGVPLGFSGLEALVSDVSSDLEEAARAPRAPLTVALPPAPVAQRAASENGGFVRVVGVLLGIMPAKLWVGAIFFLGMWTCSKLTSEPPRRHYSPPAADYTRFINGRTQPDYVGVEGTSAARTPDYTETKPPVGTGRSLSTDELRYCVFENERLDRMKPLIVNNKQVAKFNRFVEDYNSRCGSFRYQPTRMDAIRQEAVGRADLFAAEARKRLK